MAAVRVRLPVGAVRGDAPRVMECDASSVGEALAECVAKAPGLKGAIFADDGSIRVAVFVNGRRARSSVMASTPLWPGDEMRLVPPIAGG